MKKGLAYMVLGMGVGIGAMTAVQQYRNGNMKKAYNKIANKTQKSQGNMM